MTADPPGAPHPVRGAGAGEERRAGEMIDENWSSVGRGTTGPSNSRPSFDRTDTRSSS